MFQYGIDTLPKEHAGWLEGLRFGLAAHPASRTIDGTPSWVALQSIGGLSAIFGPEHGFLGAAGAGETVDDSTWQGIPVYSLYGTSRKPSPAMLENLDAVVVDFQDLAVRCYTYVSTLDLIMEAASEQGLTVIVCDRPDPLAACIDGPLLDDSCSSFVGQVNVPYCYGMTIGETARWLKHHRNYSCPLHVAPAQVYDRQPAPEPDWPDWTPPSPAIRKWETAWTYPTLVFVEALPFLDCRRSTDQAFQVLSAEGLDSNAVAEQLSSVSNTGIATKARNNLLVFNVTQPNELKPAAMAVHLLAALQEVHGPHWLWDRAENRPEFFDKLLGTARVREMLIEGAPTEKIIQSWQPALHAFAEERKAFLLYA